MPDVVVAATVVVALVIMPHTRTWGKSACEKLTYAQLVALFVVS